MAITPQNIKDWLAYQDSYDYQPALESVKVVKDPKVPGTFAVQFSEGDDVVQLLFVTGGEEGTPDEILDRTLEEVEFDSWPPTSGSLKFFW